MDDDLDVWTDAFKPKGGVSLVQPGVAVVSCCQLHLPAWLLHHLLAATSSHLWQWLTVAETAAQAQAEALKAEAGIRRRPPPLAPPLAPPPVHASCQVPSPYLPKDHTQLLLLLVSLLQVCLLT